MSSANYSDPHLKLFVPMYYNGKEFYQIYLVGDPFRGVQSVFSQVKKQIGVKFLYEGNPTVTIDTFTAENLTKEAMAYAIRANFYGSKDGPVRNPAKAVENIDDFLRIVRINEKHSTYGPHKSGARNERLLASIYLTICLADIAVDKKNYSLAKKLLTDTNSRLDQSMFQVSDDMDNSMNRQPLIAEQIMQPLDQTLKEYINQKLKDVTKKEKTDPSENNLLPEYGAHPNSISSKLEGLVEEEKFEVAAKIRDEMESTSFALIANGEDDFLPIVGKYLLQQIVPADSTLRFYNRNRVDVKCNGENILFVGGTNRFGGTIGLYKPGLLPWVEGLVTSDPIVTMFGRNRIKITQYTE